MGFRVKIALLFIINIVWIQQTLCDGNLTNSEANTWECECVIQDLRSVSSYCLSSCNCSIESTVTWKCICPNGGMPRMARDDNDNNCFLNCDCHAGTLIDSHLGMPVGIILLIVFSSMIGFVVIVFGVIFLLDKFCSRSQISCSSATRLESQGASV